MQYNQLKLLAIYATVVESGSFAAAARKLHSSRSRVSEQVSTLEEQLGIRLLQRSTRKLQLTDEGESIYLEARQLGHLLDRVESIATPEDPRGRVKITLNQDIAHHFLLPVLAQFSARYPNVKLDLSLDDSPQDLIAEQIDLAIRVGFPKDSGLIARVLHEESFRLFASPDYLRTYGEPGTVEQLAQHHWILINQAMPGDVVRLKNDEGSVEIKPESFYRCNSPHLTQRMVVEGLGIAALLPATVRPEINSGSLVPIMPELRSETLVFSLVYPSRKQVPVRTRVVIDFLLEAQLFSGNFRSTHAS